MKVFKQRVYAESMQSAEGFDVLGRSAEERGSYPVKIAFIGNGVEVIVTVPFSLASELMSKPVTVSVEVGDDTIA